MSYDKNRNSVCDWNNRTDTCRKRSNLHEECSGPAPSMPWGNIMVRALCSSHFATQTSTVLYSWCCCWWWSNTSISEKIILASVGNPYSALADWHCRLGNKKGRKALHQEFSKLTFGNLALGCFLGFDSWGFWAESGGSGGPGAEPQWGSWGKAPRSWNIMSHLFHWRTV